MPDDRGSVGPATTMALCGVVAAVGGSAWVGWLIAGRIEPAVGVATVVCALLLAGMIGLLVRTGVLSVRVNLPPWLRRAEEAGRAEPRQSDAVRRVIALGAEEARHFRQAGIGTEHLLLGVMREGGEGARALAAAGVTLEALIRAVDAIAGIGTAAESPEPLALSTSARRALENAAARARAEHRHAVQVRHLLLALAQERGGVAAGILDHFGCTVATLTAAFAQR